MKSKETFATVLQSFNFRYDLRTVFNDFLTMTLCAFSQNPRIGKSYDEDLYMETIAKYSKDEARHKFPEMFALLIEEMEERVGSSSGNDVLGGFYEENLYQKRSAQFFTPPHVCDLMAKMACGTKSEDEKPLRILDPCCGSGRNLLAGAKELGRQHRYYGIDIDHTCVKMAAINLFLNGVFHAEVMWADALDLNDFRMSYKLSFLPFGIFRIQEKERSRLWHMNQNSPPEKEVVSKPEIILPSKEPQQTGIGTQIKLF